MKLMTQKRSDPIALRSELDDLIARFFEPLDEQYGLAWPGVTPQNLLPPMDIGEDEKEFTVMFELPGLDEKDIHIELMGNQLRVFGERKWEHEKKAENFRRIERRFGRFERVLTLPPGLRLDEKLVQATYKQGVLDVRIPKIEPTPAAKIRVKPG